MPSELYRIQGEKGTSGAREKGKRGAPNDLEVFLGDEGRIDFCRCVFNGLLLFSPNPSRAAATLSYGGEGDK